jgi:hypothetical protein
MFKTIKLGRKRHLIDEQQEVNYMYEAKPHPLHTHKLSFKKLKINAVFS